jgi:hypothetical protein
LLDKHGLRMPGSTAFSRDNLAWLKDLCLGFMDEAILGSDLAVLEALNRRLRLSRRR